MSTHLTGCNSKTLYIYTHARLCFYGDRLDCVVCVAVVRSEIVINNGVFSVVDSNETLYGGDPKFVAEISKVCETVIGQVLDYLKTLSQDEVREKKNTHNWTYTIQQLSPAHSLILVLITKAQNSFH